MKLYKDFFTILFFDKLTLKMEVLRTSETCVPTYQTVRRSISEHLDFINTACKTTNLARTRHIERKGRNELDDFEPLYREPQEAVLF